MNLVMRDVLPTDCSPRKTSLNFLSGLLKESPDPAAIFDQDCVIVIVLLYCYHPQNWSL